MNVKNGNFIKKNGEIVNIADLLKAKAINNKKHNVKMYSAQTAIFLNSKGEECDIIEAIENLINNNDNSNVDNETVASGEYSHAEGFGSQATGKYAHAEGVKTKAEGVAAHAEGSYSMASGGYSHAEGGSTATGGYAHSEGNMAKAKGQASHAEGYATQANGAYSHAEGYATQANGDFSHTSGHYTKANTLQFVTGKRNTEMEGGATNTQTGTAFIVGNGTDQATSNAFRVDFSGEAFANSFNSSGADFAEMFEWKDGNIANEDRRGLFVTLENDKIRIANSEDTYILGVVSATPTIIGDSQSEIWKNMYLVDCFGEYLTENVLVSEYVDEELEQIIPEHEEERRILNPFFDKNKQYISRTNRQEWAPIGLLGKLVVVDDGSCEVNGYCVCGENGIATKSNIGYKVMNRIDEKHIKILLK